MDEFGWRDVPKQSAGFPSGLRRVLLSMVALSSLVAGFWFGGDLQREVSVWAIVSVGGAVLLGDLFGSPDRRWSRVVSAVLMAVLFIVGWRAGIVEVDRAFTECVERGEVVRRALDEHHRVTGQYPEILVELTALEVPGRRLLRPDLMSYSRSGEGYEIEYSDGFVRMSATEAGGFFDRE